MKIAVEKNVAVPMRDGIVLRADLYRPAGSGNFPVLVQRTPYNKEMLAFTGLTLDPIRAAAHGYAVLIQDVRARWASEGDTYFMYRDEFRDGIDTVRWVLGQQWCDRHIGAYGLSYMGAATWLMAAGSPEHLQAIAPTTAPNDFWKNHLWRGGALNLGLLMSWTLATIGPSALMRGLAGTPELPAALSALVDAVDDFDAWTRHVPVATLPPARPDDQRFVPFFFEILKHHTPDALTNSLLMNGRHSAVRSPALIVAGWHDVLLEADLEHFAAVKGGAATDEARDHTRLIIGPWAHGMFQHVVGDMDFGLRASGMFLDLREDLTGLHLRWFDRWLRGIRNDVDNEARVKIFVQGRNRWRDEPDWPLARAVETRFFLGADGGLSADAPGDSGHRSFVYDPAAPCETAGGPILLPLKYKRGPVDQAAWLSRPDVIAFTSEPLDDELEVTGCVRATLFAATSGLDTDWILRLCDVYPDGTTIGLCDGVLRARFRNGFERPALLEPERIERYEIALAPTSIVFRRGHRIRLLITSSDFPRYDRNPNTGEWPSEAARFEPARQTIFCGGEHGSHVVFPIIRASE